MIPHEVYYDEADCKRCGRKIIDEISIERGYGPVCWEKVQKEAESMTAKEKLKEIGYSNKALSNMTNEECENELQEVPYNQ